MKLKNVARQVDFLLQYYGTESFVHTIDVKSSLLVVYSEESCNKSSRAGLAYFYGDYNKNLTKPTFPHMLTKLHKHYKLRR